MLTFGAAYQGGPGSISVPWLCLFAYMTGIGGCAAFAGSIKTCRNHSYSIIVVSHRFTAALNWPNYRGTATAFPLSAFGLSAFFFSLISSLAFPDNTSDLLLLLAIATFVMVLVGAFFLRIVPNSPAYTPISERSGSDSSTLLKRTKSEENKYNSSRLSTEPGTQAETISSRSGDFKDSRRLVEPEHPDLGPEETSSLLSKSSGSAPGDVPFQNGSPRDITEHESQHVDIRGFALLSKTKFYQLWLLLGLLTGIGLMTIK